MPTISSHHEHSHAHAAPLNDDDLRDPVCGMAVTSPSKFGESYQGQAYQFCSLKCQEKFRADPERFSGNVSSAESRVTTPDSAVQTGTEFTCPMHPEIRQSGPGNCPK
ncbi:YHS domain-containing protein [Pseudomonas sp. FSL W5-0299]|nr:YHS domain-containing protein [Pseudomonas sp. FSL W5-0299]